MITSLHLPATGWFAAAQAAQASASRSGLIPHPSGVGPGEASDAPAAWERFRALQARAAPVIVSGGTSYAVIDVEPLERGERADGRSTFLHYAHARRDGDRRGHWALFLQEGVCDTAPEPLSPATIREILLAPYRDPALMVRPREITRTRVVDRGTIRRGTGGVLVQDLRLQNGHRIALFWKERSETDWVLRSQNGASREVWQVPADFLEKLIAEVPLKVLTQVDEIRVRSKYLGVPGRSLLRNGRRVVELFPNDVASVTAASHRVVDPESRALSPWAFRLHLLRYTLFHEAMGHSLVTNRFIRREILKIIAAGERPPTTYAGTSPDEWLAEGVAERWIRVAYKSPTLAEWDRDYPYLSGLTRHLLARLEGTAEAANENIRLWTRSMRRKQGGSPV